MKPTLFIHNFDFSAASSGARLMHYLPAMLAAADIPVAVKRLCYYAPAIPVKDFANADDIVVYPDCHPGNPANGRRIARYFAFFPDGFFKGERITKDEACLVYRSEKHEYLNETRAYCDHPIEDEDEITFPTIDSRWLFPERKTIKNLVYLGYPEKPRTINTFPKLDPEGFVIPYRDVPAEGRPRDPYHFHCNKRTENLLRRGENIYTTDHFSLIVHEAALAGCKPWRVHSETEFEPVDCSPEIMATYIMEPKRDIETARRFAGRIYKFFGEA